MASVVEIACARLAAEGRHWAVAGERKYAVRHFLKIGFAAPEFRARYGRLFREFEGQSLVTAMKAVELAYILEKRKRAESAKTFGRPMGSRMTISVLGEMRLMLRFMSIRTTDKDWRRICAVVTETWRSIAAGSLLAAE